MKNLADGTDVTLSGCKDRNKQQLHTSSSFTSLIAHKILNTSKKNNTKQNCMDISMTKCSSFHQEMLREIQHFVKPVTST